MSITPTLKDIREHSILSDGSKIVRTDAVPWTRLSAPGLEGISYKIDLLQKSI